MTREQLEHLIRAAADIANDDEVMVLGSQAILGSAPHARDVLVVSMEADLYPKNRPELGDLIDGSIGEGSPFHQTFGYYAQGVDEKTATLPKGWQERVVPLQNENTRGATGWCLEPHDLVISKLIAGRPKDKTFFEAAVAQGLVQVDTLRERLAHTTIGQAIRARIEVLLGHTDVPK